MSVSDAAGAAAVLRALHERAPLVLANAWDAASAAVIESVGVSAIATTSAGISWVAGSPDGERLGRDRMLRAVSEIVAVVRIPVTVDIESGYGAGADEVADTVGAFIGIGVAGINIEDSPGTDGSLRDLSTQSARIRAARAAADRAGVPLWINARTDTFLTGPGTVNEQLAATMTRAVAYASAGADSLFVPGVIDIGVISNLTTGPLPINVMAGPGCPDVVSLARAGVVRVSVGSGIAQAAYALAARAARELLDAGTYTSMGDALGYGQLNEMLRLR